MIKASSREIRKHFQWTQKIFDARNFSRQDYFSPVGIDEEVINRYVEFKNMQGKCK